MRKYLNSRSNICILAIYTTSEGKKTNSTRNMNKGTGLKFNYKTQIQTQLQLCKSRITPFAHTILHRPPKTSFMFVLLSLKKKKKKVGVRIESLNLLYPSITTDYLMYNLCCSSKYAGNN